MNNTVIRIIIASKNPVKISAAYQAFNKAFPDHTIHCEEMSAPSGVADQPMTEAETRLGSENRAQFCYQQKSHQQDANVMDENTVDYFVAMEGGVDQFEEGAATFAYVTILAKTGKMVTNRSASLPLPHSIYTRLVSGEELGDVMDDLFGTVNIKQKGGAIGLFTNEAENRESIYTQALILCLAPFIHPEHF
ncbi:Non-canonical purine NTP phosphatase [Marinomonas spartinae]|uniref:Inosine/xanthosine triphosphatase n=1 Tax=Marinomonas spartinae TaxID=1792290 RepID=A0A1A8TLF4_9GAMM|nr:inosine/xanthosine triphosphatase [Marinomonas spartinae]SBS33888.1 Non-canonical purine NTP phosphatase [Marinomonas spartinae]SBS38025.1 Non-canonical purine NTP phosphatase [Marinomonas spartinae]